MPDEPRQDASAAARKPSSRDAFLKVFPGVMLAMFLAAADQTILASALPTIASALGVIADLSWVVVAYLLAATVAAPLYGYVGDRFGRRRALLGALAVFTVASCACALAPSFWWLVGFRALQGFGGGGLMTLAQALIGEHVEPRERGSYAGYFATLFALASTSGPRARRLPHRARLVARHLHHQHSARHSRGRARACASRTWRRRAARDRSGRTSSGAFLFCIATASFLFALSSGGHRFAWLSLPMADAAPRPRSRRSSRWCGGSGVTTTPIIPIHFLKVPAIARADAVVLCFGACLFALIVYLPLYLQLGRGLGIGASGVLLLPITLAQVTSAAITGRLVTRTGHVTIFPKIGLSVVCLVFVALAFAVDRAPTAVILAPDGAGRHRPRHGDAADAGGGADRRGPRRPGCGDRVDIAMPRGGRRHRRRRRRGRALCARSIARAAPRRRCCIRRWKAAARSSRRCRSPAREPRRPRQRRVSHRVRVLAGFAAVGALIAATVPPFQWHEGEVESAEPVTRLLLAASRGRLRRRRARSGTRSCLRRSRRRDAARDRRAHVVDDLLDGGRRRARGRRR